MLYFDLDGILRDLCTPILGHDADFWGQGAGGLTMSQNLKADPDILEFAPVTHYAKTIFQTLLMYNYPLRIMTAYKNPVSKMRTAKWALGNIPRSIDYRLNFVVAERKLGVLKPGDYLVEDYPNFPSYDQVILIEHNYNQGVRIDANRRISSPDQLQHLLQHLIATGTDRSKII